MILKSFYKIKILQHVSVVATTTIRESSLYKLKYCITKTVDGVWTYKVHLPCWWWMPPPNYVGI